MNTIIRSVTALAVLSVAACTLQSQDAPTLAGPSEFGLSLDIRASPDVLMQDGGSQSVITITARDRNAQPVAGLGLLVQTQVGGVLVDYGRLSAKSVVTNQAGTATVVYTAPPPPPATATSDTLVTIVVTPVGTNYDSTFSRGIGIRLSRPGVILPPNGIPVASFVFAPSAPRVADAVSFDASPSTDDGIIVRYEWSFGDGQFDARTTPFVQKAYGTSGTFIVRLTVVDDRGLSASVERTITVGAASQPTASFTFSPTDPGVGQQVTFDASASAPPEDAEIASYRWNFGDGTEPVTTNDRIRRHTFTSENTFTVTLTVTDTRGRSHTISQTVTVGS